MKNLNKKLFCLGCTLFLCFITVGSVVAIILFYNPNDTSKQDNADTTQPTTNNEFNNRDWNDLKFIYPDNWSASFGNNMVMLKPYGANVTTKEPINETVIFTMTPLSQANHNMTVDNLRNVDLSQTLKSKGAVNLSQSKLQINGNTWIKSITEWKDQSKPNNKYRQISYSTITNYNSYSVFYQFDSHTNQTFTVNAEKIIQSITF